MSEIYLDYAATAPLDPAVGAAMHDCMLREFGNPSSQHAAGRRARALVEAARAAVAARVGAASDGIVFTSGATESNNLALQGVLRRSRGRRVHLVTSRIEHKSVL
jgi:cysteine desulfurase